MLRVPYSQRRRQRAQTHQVSCLTAGARLIVVHTHTHTPSALRDRQGKTSINHARSRGADLRPFDTTARSTVERKRTSHRKKKKKTQGSTTHPPALPEVRTPQCQTLFHFVEPSHFRNYRFYIPASFCGESKQVTVCGGFETQDLFCSMDTVDC